MNRKLPPAGLAGLAVLAALVIAFLMRDVVEQAIIRPAIYLFWMLSVLYRFVPQPVLWLLLVLIMIYLALGRLVSKFETPAAPRAHKSNPVQGPVDELASRIERKDEGIYFKWQIARTLGHLAIDLQDLRQHTHSRKLEFNNAKANPRVRHYLDAGLNTSFSEYPLARGLSLPGGLALPGSSKTMRSTPFDGDIGPMIDYLESEMENDDDFRRP